MAKTCTAVVNKRIPMTGATGAWYIGTITADTSYATGGDELLTAASPNLRLPEKIEAMFISPSLTGYTGVFVAGATPKVRFNKAQGTEVASEANISTEVFPFVAIGA